MAAPEAVRARRDVVVTGASAGGVEALTRLAALLPADLEASILVVLHLPAEGPSALPQILSRSGPLPARHAGDGEPLEHGSIVVAPPDRHLELVDHTIRLSSAPRENGYRPARVKRTLAYVVEDDPAVLVVDLTATSFFDSTSLRALLEADRKRRRKRQNGLRVVTNALVRRLLEISGLDTSLALFPSIDAALAPRAGRRGVRR